ncbi:dGTPase [Vibrio anguillarum]|uniref:dGTPase n=1 Tax=Vibrio anguillarum TaxID=55601 RepID=UPI000210EBE2|nr:dGTPase [Vibrio anguillarum]AEH32917.1 Deoxyguanosinetriphosphate triphosphohydrolase [Vibrio anguillarum 775]ATA49236.1 dGTPase [Vibrio anguillarum]MBT2983037.1 dGTPase [Vibrio anguillarum]MBT3006672.1 dGTPase [Vibrio anguillarum]UJQ40701.1 dGTPase [Vibrio anguillarum]
MMINFNQKVRGTRVYYKGQTSPPQALKTLTRVAEQENFESDRGRILNSAAVRRLQQKTQVFPLERNAAVRSRLTHSLEVQQVGRFITQLIFKHLPKEEQEKYFLEGLDRQIESIVEMSCVMHDIGNPPFGHFGHFGEQAINDWFTRNLPSLITNSKGEPRVDLPPEIKKDLENFEGNSQAIRLVHTILGLNLTYSQVSGVFKYTRRGDQTKPDPKNEQDPFKDYSYLMKKVGYYLSEHQYIESMKLSLSMDEHCRSPFSYIMEAADDISYGIADIEDAIEKGILNLQQLSDALNQEYHNIALKFGVKELNVMEDILNNVNKSTKRSETCGNSQFFIGMRVEINKRLPQHACKQFIEHIEEVFNGNFNRALIEDKSSHHTLVEALKSVARKYAFCDPDVEQSELQGYRIITGLLEAYKPLLMLDSNTFRNISEAPLYECRLYKKLPNKHLKAYNNAMQSLSKKNGADIPFVPFDFNEDVWEFYFRVRLIQDYISGMTDQFAFDEYRAFHVID